MSRYDSPVAGLEPDALAAALRKSIAEVEANFPPHTGVCVFAFDFNPVASGGGIGYIANAQRGDMVRALREWLDKQARPS